MPLLKSSEVKAFYDRFGRMQDTQAFYEDHALGDLIRYSRLGEARKLFEFGCGTGRMARRLLGECLPAKASYCGCDLSPTMVRLAKERLAEYGARARVTLTDGSLRFPLQARSVDRVLSAYVLDLLSGKDIGKFLGEARRVLRPGGKLCVMSLTEGTTGPSRLLTGAWKGLFRLNGSLVGGCRPIKLERWVRRGSWVTEHRKVVVSFGVPTEVLVARPKRS